METEVSEKLIGILGGKEAVIKVFKENNLLSNDQQQQISELIGETHDKNSYKNGNINIYLGKFDDLFHRIFNYDNATKLYHITMSKYTIRCLITLILINFVVTYLSRFIITWNNTAFTISTIPVYFIYNIFMLLFICTLNYFILGELIFSFDFAFKLFNCIVYWFCQILLWNQYSNNITAADVIQWCFAIPFSIFALILASSLDACNKSRNLKSLMLTLWMIILVTLYIQAYTTFNSINDVIITVFNFDISIKNKYTSSLLNLILFIGKETFYSIKYRNSNLSIQMKLRPHIHCYKYQQYTINQQPLLLSEQH